MSDKPSGIDDLIFLNNYKISITPSFFNILKNCQCCEKHKLNFPTNEKDIKNFYCEKKANNRKQKYKGPKAGQLCICPCRHIARDICRKMHEEYFENDSMSDSSESLASNDSERSSESNSSGSLNDFIVKDNINPRIQKKLDKIKNQLRKSKFKNNINNNNE